MLRHLGDWAGGRLPLAVAFWQWAILVGTLLNLVFAGAAFAVLSAGGSGVLALAVFMAPLPYNVLATIGVWRSAGRYPGPAHWRDAARIAVVCWLLAATLI